MEDRLRGSQQRYDQLQVELEHEIDHLKQQIEQQQIDYQNLLDIKIGLDREIATYRKLLESEEKRSFSFLFSNHFCSILKLLDFIYPMIHLVLLVKVQFRRQ